MRSLILFTTIQAMAFFFGSSDTETITLVVFLTALTVFISAYFSAYKKDLKNKVRNDKAVFEVQ